MFKLFRVLLPVLIAANMFTAAARAQEGWTHTLVPLYLWGAGIEGSSQVGPVSAPISISFADALDNLDTTLTVHYEANKGKWGVLADAFHLSLAPEATLSTGAPVDVGLTNNIFELGGIYRPETLNGLEVLFGVRAMQLELDASVGTAPEKTLVDQDLVDAFAGARKKFSLSKNTGLMLRGDVGAGDSEFVWNAALLLDYRFNKTVSMLGGYRWLDYDYQSGSGRDRFTYDVTYEGPAIALRFDW